MNKCNHCEEEMRNMAEMVGENLAKQTRFYYCTNPSCPSYRHVQVPITKDKYQ